jgi:hypothetical protein
MSEMDRTDVALPDSLKEQLRMFEHRLYIVETVVAVCGAIGGFLLTYGILFLSDRFWDTPRIIRALLTIAGGLLFAGFATWWSRHWRWQRRGSRELAKLIQVRHAGLGDRLLGAVELATGDSMPPDISPALCKAAISQVAAETAKYDFKNAVSNRRSRIYSIAFAVLFVITAIPFILFPEAGRTTLIRLANPMTGVERYTFVSIESLPDKQVVPHGEEFEICCVLKRISLWHSVSASCRFENQPEIKAAISGGTVVFHVPGQTMPGVLTIHIGDVVKNIGITPVYRPELVKLTASVALPDYLKQTNANVTLAMEGGRAEILEGSAVKFTGVVSRKLSNAFLYSGVTNRLEVNGERFISRELAPEKITNCVFQWKDCYGLGAAQPYPVTVAALKDEPPKVQCRGIARSVAILEDEIVEPELNAEDDYGLRELAINWTTSGKDRSTPETRFSRILKQGSPVTKTLTGQYSFSPITAHVSEETVVALYASATDYLPGRDPATSPICRIYVVSRVKHAKVIQEQMEALQGKIEDLAREEEKLLNSNQKLGELKPDALASEKTTDNLKDNRITERDNASKLSRIADDAEKLLKEALRNKDISEKTLGEWAELMQKMRDEASGDMPAAAGALQDAANKKPQRADNLAKAIKLEEQILKALKDARKGINKSLEDMIARSFVNRLRAAGTTERDIATSFRTLLPVIVGVRPEDLSSENTATLNRSAMQQDATKKEAGYIQDDLAGFYNRTRVACYDTIHEEMVKKKTVEQLSALSSAIKANMTVRSIEETQAWHDQFNAWADFMEKSINSSSCSGNSEGEQLEESDIEVLIALMRARQKEESLREQTRLLEEGKDGNASWAGDSCRLADNQSDLERDTAMLERKSLNPALRKLADKVGGEMMNAAVYLRRPQTDSATVAIETEIIEILSNIIASSCGQQGGARAQMLMKALGLMTNPTGGGSNAGGTTEKPNVTASGPSSATPAETREIEKTGGSDAGDWPEEFKDALDAYLNAVEEKK